MNSEEVTKITTPIEQWVKEDDKRGALVIVFEETVKNDKAGVHSCEVLFGEDSNMLAKAISAQADSPNSVLCPLVTLKMNEFLQNQLGKRRQANG